MPRRSLARRTRRDPLPERSAARARADCSASTSPAEDAPDLLIGAALDCYGRIDVLVNNAGWAPPRTPLLKMRPVDLDRMIAVNLRAPIALTRLAAAAMTPLGAGTIVNVASSAAIKAPAGEAVYAATKAALIAFTRASFHEMRQSGLKLSVIASGPGRYRADSEQQAARSRCDAFDSRRRARRDADRELARALVPGRSDARAATRSGAPALSGTAGGNLI